MLASQCLIGLLMVPLLWLTAQGHKVLSSAYDSETMANARDNARELGGSRGAAPAADGVRGAKLGGGRGGGGGGAGGGGGREVDLTGMSARDRLTYYTQRNAAGKEAGGKKRGFFSRA